MDWFVAAFWLMMFLGLLAVAVPAYWLVSGWWQDRERPEELSSPIANDGPMTPSSFRILTAGEALTQPMVAAAVRRSSSDRERPDQRAAAVANDTSLAPLSAS